MAGNKSLNAAAKAKQDEFYTQLTDIEKELRHYKKHFAGKTVFCNCDDPFESNFFKYFVLNFNRLGLKKLIATCYAGSPIAGSQLSLFDVLNSEQTPEVVDKSRAEQSRAEQSRAEQSRPYKAIVTTVYDKTGDGAVDMYDVAELFKSHENELTELKGDGDFRSPECLSLMDEADIVVTNPPFSLFREYVAVLMEHKKGFIIIGPYNATKYKEIFPLLIENKIWLGYNNGDMAFTVPETYEPKATRYWQDESGQKWRSMGNIAWFTNLDIKKRHEEMILVKRYTEDAYPKYTNLDAIDVKSAADIPCDYAGWMGVPITFMENYNPDQFELIGTSTGELGRSIGVTPNHRGRTDVAYIGEDGKPKCPYQRFIIRNKHPEPPRDAQ